MQRYDLTILVPFLNEQENLPRLVSELNTFIPKNFKGFVIELLFIDDGSTDESVKILDACSFHGMTARLLRLSRRFGSHEALRAGILHARGSAITFLMADMQDPPSILPMMFTKFQSGFDVVWARRTNHAESSFLQFGSRLYAWLIRKFALPNFPTHGADVLMIGEKVRSQLNRCIEGNSSIFLQIMSFGFNQTWIDYERRPRAGGKSKWTFARRLKLAIDSFIAFSYAPIRFVSVLAIVFLILGSIWLSVIFVRAIFFGNLVPGWPALIGILLIGFGLTNLSLGIIAEYLWRVLDSARQRPVFIVDSDVELVSRRSEHATKEKPKADDLVTKLF